VAFSMLKKNKKHCELKVVDEDIQDALTNNVNDIPSTLHIP